MGECERMTEQGCEKAQIRWVIGHQSQVRVEAAEQTVVCDEKWMYVTLPELRFPHYQVIELSEPRKGTSLEGCRNWVTVCCLHLCLYIVDPVSVKLLFYGEKYPKMVQKDGGIIASAGYERINDYLCHKIFVYEGGYKYEIWLDTDVGVLRRFAFVEGVERMCTTTYETIKMNHYVDQREFAIPEDVLKKADKKAFSSQDMSKIE
jgi:hypothetical protein